MADTEKQLAKVVAKHQELLQELQFLLQHPHATPTQIERTQRQLLQVQAEQTRLLNELQIKRLSATEEFSNYGNLASQRPMREQVLDILNEIRVAASPRAISEFAAAVYGYSLPSARFASLRRDEERAFRKDALSRPAWVVPAINVLGLAAMPRLVASSSWPAERRLIGARTLRTNHLRILLALLSARERLLSTSEARPNKMQDTLIRRYAQTVPGAFAMGDELNPVYVRDVVLAELACVEPEDLEERQAAAAELERLSEPFRTWGRPVLVEGEALRGRVFNE